MRNYWANMSQVCCLSHLVSAPRREVARTAGFDVGVDFDFDFGYGYGCIFQPVNISGKLTVKVAKVSSENESALGTHATCYVQRGKQQHSQQCNSLTANSKQHTTCNMQWEKGRLACNAICLLWVSGASTSHNQRCMPHLPPCIRHSEPRVSLFPLPNLSLPGN